MRSPRRSAPLKLSAVVLLLCAACACVQTAGSQKESPKTQVEQPPSGAELVAGYKSWARVNPVPAVFHSRIAIQCSRPSPEQQRMEQENPHRDKFVTVYVNEAGRRPMFEARAPRFPVGTLIVKEKLPARDATEPELLTAMYKREAGYDPERGDWEYMVLDGAGTEVRARGKLESCRACHESYSGTDFVSRNYLPSELFQKLK